MSRFFKSAAFPILIVVVLAFFAQKLISPGDKEKKPIYSGTPDSFVSKVKAGQVKSVTVNTKDNTLGMRPPHQARPAQGGPADPLDGLRDPQPLRDRIWPGPLRAVPQPPLRGRVGVTS